MNPAHDLMRARLQTAAELHDLGVAMKRQSLRRAHPDADDAAINAMLGAWLQERPGAEHGDGVGRVVAWPRPLTDAQRAELDRRLADLDAHGSQGAPWEIVRERIRAPHKVIA